MTLDEVGTPFVFLESRIINGNDLYDGFATRFKQFAKGLEVGGPPAFPHCLEHFYRDDMVVLSLHIAVIR